MSKINTAMLNVIHWLTSRVAVIYIVVFIFCLTCVDLKMLEMRIKVRRLNSSIPDFSEMIVFSKDQHASKHSDWGKYKKYFNMILNYVPDDLLTKQLLGFVDYYTGQEQKAIALFKGSTEIKGQGLFWSNYDLGVLFYKKEMWPQAAEYLLKAISSSPKLTLILMQNSTVYRQIFACPVFKYSIEDEINNAQSSAYLLLLSSLYNMRQYDKVIIVSNLGLANQNLTYKDAFYYYAGLSYYQAGQLEKAFLLFQKSLAMEKNNPDVYYYIADIYEKAGQMEQARDFLRISYDLHQKHDPRFPYEASVNLRFF